MSDLNAKLTEAQFQQMVVDRATVRGWLVHHARPAPTQSGGWATPIQGNAGFPDLVMAKMGVLLIVELKSEKGRMGPGQNEWLTHLRGDNRFVAVWRPSDWPEICDILDAFIGYE